MSNNIRGLSSALTGMYTDLHPSNIKDGMYMYMLNGVVENFDGNGFPLVQNAQSNIKCTDFPEGYVVVGHKAIVEQKRILWFLYNPTTEASQIGESLYLDSCYDLVKDGYLPGLCDDCEAVKVSEVSPLETVNQSPCCQFFTINESNCLNFSDKHPVNSIQYVLEDCGLTIYFTDGVNPRRYLEFKYLNDEPSQRLVIDNDFLVITGFNNPPCEDPIYGTEIDCNKINVQPFIKIPCLEFIDLVPGGSNKAGVYQFFIAFSDEQGNVRSSYFSSTNPIPIKTRNVTFETNYITDRAIVLDVKNLDPLGANAFYKIAVAKTIDKTTSFFEVGVFPITQTRVTYTGNNESEVKLSAFDIFTRYPYYTNANHVTISNSILYWAGVTQPKKLNLQRIANNIILNWQTIAIPEDVYSNPRNVNKFRSAMRDEVYPYGIQFLFDSGYEANVYHIPGREAKTSDLEIVSNNDVVSENNCVDCGNTVVPSQVVPGPLNTVTFVPGGSLPTLVLDNSNQSASCPLTPYSDTPTTPVVGTGTPPTVDAGIDQTINHFSGILLSGLVVVFSPNTLVSTTWKQLSGPAVATLSNPGSLTPYFTLYYNGTYVFELAAVDSGGNLVTDTVTINVTVPVNVAPISDPGSDKIVFAPVTTSFLNGTASVDPGGVITSFAWTQLSGPNTATISDPSSSYTEISGLIVGTYRFQLVVTDNQGCSSTSTTYVYVLPDGSTSAPECTNMVYPVNGSITPSPNSISLQWNASAFATLYDLYIWEDGNPIPGTPTVSNISATNYVVSSLNSNTVYNWFVTPKNGAGSATGCSAYYRTFVTPAVPVSDVCETPRWKVYNTATVLGGPLEIYNECEETCYQYGEFAYWESTERYPNNPEIWGDLCGQPIRHHKYPDSIISHIHDNRNGLLDYTKSNIVYPIGVKVDHDSIRASIALAVSDGIITQAEADSIIGYRIVRGNRFNNKSIIAKGLLFDMNQYRRKKNGDFFDDEPIFFANYPYNDLRPNQFITDDFENYERHNDAEGPDLPFIFSKRYTFHSPDTHFNQPASGTILKLETVEYGLAEGYYNKCDEQSRQRFLSTTSYLIALTTGILDLITKEVPIKKATYTVRGVTVSGLGVASGVFGPSTIPPIGALVYNNTIPNPATNGLLVPAVPPITGGIPETATVETISGLKRDYLNPVKLAREAPYLLPFLPFMLANFVTSRLTELLDQTNITLRLIESLTPYRDWTIQYNSVGKYNAYVDVPNAGNKIRQIRNYSYLKSENISVNEIDDLNPSLYRSTKINNWNRESSLYLRYNGELLPDAGTASGIQDQSRQTLENYFDCDLNKRKTTQISSYYASLKNFVPDQYGSIFNIEYLLTDSCTFDINTPNSECRGVYGGDTFINRFALKIKVPYFLANTFRLPDGTDFNYSAVPNLAVPRYYYDSTLGVGSEINDIGDILSIFTPDGLATFLGRPKSLRDCNTAKFFYQNGYIYLFHYGIPNFFVESDVNVDFRHAENSLEKDFYPNQQDLDFWLQEKNVPIKEDNYYFYNSTYSKQNKETPLFVDPITFDPNKECETIRENRIIYATDDNFLTYRANDFYDFPISKGPIISVEGIENDSVLVRTTNSMSIFKSVIRTVIEGQTVQQGTGGVFSNSPQEFAETTLGYVGTQHKAILHTEYGHVTVDAKRGQVFVVAPNGSGLDEISKNGMKNFFKNNLPFRILRDFPNMPIEHADNAYAGVGLILAFDKRFNQFYLTKRDYVLKDKSVRYDPVTREFYRILDNNRVVVSLGDKRYFSDCSWTIAYNFFLKTWISFYSFKPNYYVDFIDYFGSGLKSSFWLHNISNYSYQVFYGKLHPFIFEPVSKFTAELKTLNAVEFDTEVRRYNNEYDYRIKKNIPGVNKVVVYNDHYNSGLINLEVTDKNDLTKVGIYPIKNYDSWTSELSLSNYKWRFNQFFNLLKDNSEVLDWLHDLNNADKSLNPVAFNYKKDDFTLARMKGQWFKMRFINDLYSNYKIIHKFSDNNLTIQLR